MEENPQKGITIKLIDGATRQHAGVLPSMDDRGAVPAYEAGRTPSKKGASGLLITGLILAPVGATTTAVGAILFATQNGKSEGGYFAGIGMMGGGGLIALTGLMLMLAGSASSNSASVSVRPVVGLADSGVKISF